MGAVTTMCMPVLRRGTVVTSAAKYTGFPLCAHLITITVLLLTLPGIVFGQAAPKPSETIAITDQVQVSAVVHGPQVVKAGEDVEFVLTLDKAINFEGANVQVLIVGPDASFSYGIGVQPGVKVYHFRFRVPPAATGGTWAVDKLTFNSGAGKGSELPFKRYTFEVIPNTGLTYPTSADIGVNPSQIQLLRTEAVKLQTRIRELKATLVEKSSDHELISVLSRNIEESLAALQATATRFQNLSTDRQQSSASQVFFGDLRTSYKEAADKLHQLAEFRQDRGALRFVNFEQQTRVPGQGDYPLISQGVLRVLEQNEVAYTIVADAQSLMFDLALSSTPQGASTALRRRGDSFENSGQLTDCTIKALPYAIWIVRFEKHGYRPEEREHDPFREPNHVVNIALKKQ